MTGEIVVTGPSTVDSPQLGHRMRCVPPPTLAIGIARPIQSAGGGAGERSLLTASLPASRQLELMPAINRAVTPIATAKKTRSADMKEPFVLARRQVSHPSALPELLRPADSCNGFCALGLTQRVLPLRHRSTSSGLSSNPLSPAAAFLTASSMRWTSIASTVAPTMMACRVSYQRNATVVLTAVCRYESF
jgi:hypothetical protein